MGRQQGGRGAGETERALRRQTRRQFVQSVAVIGAGLSVLDRSAAVAHAQQQYRVGYLGLATAETEALVFEGLRQGLQDLGLGEQVTLVPLYADGFPERLPLLASQLASLPLNVIVASSSAPAAALKQVTSLPVVAGPSGDLVAGNLGLVSNLARPERNVTGVAGIPSHLSVEQLRLFKEAVPSVSRMAVYYNPSSHAHAASLEAIRQAAPDHGVNAIIPIAVANRAQVIGALNQLDARHADSLLTLGGPAMTHLRYEIIAGVLARKMPSLHSGWRFFLDGALLSYALNSPALFKTIVAKQVERVLRGESIANISVARGSLSLGINLRTARRIGVQIPDTVIQKAEQTIPDDGT